MPPRPIYLKPLLRFKLTPSYRLPAITSRSPGPQHQKTMPLPVRCLPGGGDNTTVGGTPPSSPLSGRGAGLRFWLIVLGRCCCQARLGPSTVQPVAPAGDGDHLGVVQEAVEDRGGGGHVADQFAPVLQRAVAGHHRRADLVTAHDDLEEVLAGA